MNLEELLAAGKAARSSPKEVQLPELGTGKAVHVRQLSAGDLIAMVAQLRELTGDAVTVARERAAISLATFLCDADGSPLATTEKARELVGMLSIEVVQRIIDAGNQFNAVNDEAPAAQEKN